MAKPGWGGAAVKIALAALWACKDASAEAAPSAPASAHAACAEPPPDMVCVPGGPAVLGADDQGDAERPRHRVQVSTFYIDRHEVTHAQYEACERGGGCPRRKGLPKSYGPFLQADLPAIPITWTMANTYCVWAGKRLPFEAEWEKAARGGEQGRLYSWGDEPPTCHQAAYKDCAPAVTRPVGSFAPGAYDLFDMAGNGYEWVKDWASPCYDGCAQACGAACVGDDPRGPCAGAPGCPAGGKRVLKGGSWYWPASELRASARRAERPESGLHRLSFRCASSTPALTAWPPRALADPPDDPGDPAPPSAAELARFREVPEDNDIMTIAPCKRAGKATLNCRDPMSYIKTNEGLQPLWTPYLRNLGGGYVGLGADQSYDFMALAKSRWAWIFDYDPTVVRVHYIIRAVALAKETPADFAAAFAAKNLTTTRAVVRASLTGNAKEQQATDRLLREIHGALAYHYTKSLEPRWRHEEFGWLCNAEHYRYVRLLLQQGRVSVLKGNLLTPVVMPGIAESARALGVPIRVYYPSNAESQWSHLPEQYRQNVRALPFDEQSIVLRTLLGKRWNQDAAQRWHYIVQAGRHCQEGLAHYDRVSAFMDERLPTGVPQLSVIRLPGARPAATLGRVP